MLHEEHDEPAGPVHAFHHDLADVGGLRRSGVKPERGGKVRSGGPERVSERRLDVLFMQNDDVRGGEELRAPTISRIEQGRPGFGDPGAGKRDRKVRLGRIGAIVTALLIAAAARLARPLASENEPGQDTDTAN